MQEEPLEESFSITIQGVYKHDSIMTRSLMDWMVEQARATILEHITPDPSKIIWECDPGTWAKLVPVKLFLDWDCAGTLNMWGPVEMNQYRDHIEFPHARTSSLLGSHTLFHQRTGYDGMHWIHRALTKKNAWYHNIYDRGNSDDWQGWQAVRKTLSRRADYILHFVDSKETAEPIVKDHFFGGALYADSANWIQRFQFDIQDQKLQQKGVVAEK